MSDGTLPDPPVPAEADLRGLEWMPFYGNRLFGSGFDAHADDTAFRAGLQLWWAAWNQVPAASLPDDDVALCRLAGFGRDLRTWRRHRALALRGFVPCSDGRLYHMAIAGWAIEAWERRRRDRDRKARYRTAQRRGPPRPVPVAKTADRTGEDRGGEDRSESVSAAPAPRSRSAPIPSDWEPSASARAELSLSRPDLDAQTLDRRMVEFRAWCAETGKRTFNPDATWLGFMVKTHVRSDSRDSASRSGSGPSRRDSHARAAAASDGIDAAFARRSVFQRQ